MVAAVLVLLAYLPAAADDLYVYPSQGQTDEQLGQDRFACHQWAVKASGFDPSAFAELVPSRVVRVPVPSNTAAGATGRGVVIGSIAGAIVGAHDSTAGKGAAIGAVVGALAGATVEEQGRLKAEQQATAEAARQERLLAQSKVERALRRSDYRRAIEACLEGRGYTVR
jgi:outer membrane lipoprotein SlyB